MKKNISFLFASLFILIVPFVSCKNLNMNNDPLELVLTYDANLSDEFPSGFTYSKYKLPDSVHCYEWANPNSSKDLVEILDVVIESSSLQEAHDKLQNKNLKSFKERNSNFPKSEDINNLVYANCSFIDDDNYLHLYTSIPNTYHSFFSYTLHFSNGTSLKGYYINLPEDPLKKF